MGRGRRAPGDGMSVRVLKPGLATCVQDHPGRRGHYASGFPPSGPVDAWSHRLANIAVGNPSTAATLECQLLGPTLRFETPATFALCGADLGATLDGVAVARWTAINARAGSLLSLGFAGLGARAYLAFAGGIDVPVVLGSRSTFAKAGIGGFGGRALRTGDVVALRADSSPVSPGHSIPENFRPPLAASRRWKVEAVRGPHDDWIDEVTHTGFGKAEWRVSARSDRTGMRLEGPAWTFTPLAIDKPAENGSHPSNIVDYGYPIGGVNLGGQTPIVLLNDALNMGGFICPYTVPSVGFWKLGQCRPGDTVQFEVISTALSQQRAAALEGLIAACATSRSST